MLIGKRRKKTFTVQIDGIYNIKRGHKNRNKEQEETESILPKTSETSPVILDPGPVTYVK